MTSSKVPSRLKHLFKKFDILIFYIIAFMITWTGWLVMDTIITYIGPDADMGQLFLEGHYYLILWPFLAMGAVWGPLLSAFIVYSVNYGKVGSRELLKKIVNWRVAIPWYVIAIVVPILIKYGAYYFNVWFLGGTFVSDFERVSILVFLLKFFEELVPSGGQEEVGWTGFAQLRLQQQFSVIPATLIKALLGWIWHLPLYFVFPWSGVYGSDIWIFLIYYIPTAFILTWLFNNTNSVLIPALFHATFNTIGANASTGFTSMSNVTLTLLVLSALAYLVVILAFVKDGKNLTKKELPTITPAPFQEMEDSETLTVPSLGDDTKTNIHS